MRILDSTLTCSNLAAKTQSHQPPLSTLEHLNSSCVVVGIEKHFMATISALNSNRKLFNSTLQHFSQ